MRGLEWSAADWSWKAGGGQPERKHRRTKLSAKCSPAALTDNRRLCSSVTGLPWLKMPQTRDNAAYKRGWGVKVITSPCKETCKNSSASSPVSEGSLGPLPELCRFPDHWRKAPIPTPRPSLTAEVTRDVWSSGGPSVPCPPPPRPAPPGLCFQPTR